VNFVRLALQILLPLGLLAGGYQLSRFVASKAPRPAVLGAVDTRPRVRLQPATTEDVQLEVTTQGSVEPARVVELSAQVGGRIERTSDALRSGGDFAAGAELLRIDPADYELAVVQQTAAIARAELRLLQERAEAEAAVRAWRQLEGDRAADPLVTRGPQIQDAEAALAAARAALQKAKLDLARTTVQAPFAGRVRSVAAELGQTVQPGQRLATLLDTTWLEVRLPLPLADAAFVDLPLATAAAADAGAPVTLATEFAGRRHEWTGRIVRSEGEIDRRTRQLTVVARVDPAAGGSDPARPPLLVGMFVQARIQGRRLPGVVTIPRSALRGTDEVWVAGPSQDAAEGQDRGALLQRRRIDVLRLLADRVLVQGGLVAGEAVCITPLDAPTDGMPVRVAATTPATR
jgi:RND family efflux transporter MFP subunit